MSERSPHLLPADIHAAADSLLRETQEMPSDRDVLVRLGRGSLTTINRGMIRWRKSKAMRLLDLAQPDVPEPVMNLVREMWMQASSAAADHAALQLAGREAALEAKQRQFEHEAEELRLRARNAEALLDVEKRERGRVIADAEGLTRELAGLQQNVSALASRNKVFESEAEAKSQLLAQTEQRERALSQQLDRQSEQHRDSLARAKERHASEIKLHVQRTEDQRGRVDRAEAAAAKASSRADARIETLEVRVSDAERSRNEYAAQATQAHRQADALSAERDTWRARAEERDTTISMLQKTIEDLRTPKANAVDGRRKQSTGKRSAPTEQSLFPAERET